MKLLQSVFSRLLADALLLILALGFIFLLYLMPEKWSSLAPLIDWHTMAILTGLMVLSRGLEDSGSLARAGYWLLARVKTERQLALSLVCFAALLSAVITNDVALFIVVPLTISLGRMAQLPTGRLIIFEALAVNAGSAVSPIGNPQNLYLWQLSGESVGTFLLGMLPIFLWMFTVLLLLTVVAFSKRSVSIDLTDTLVSFDSRLMRGSLACYPIFLILIELGQTALALAGIILLFLLCWRRVLKGVDWSILLIFILMFIDLGLLAQLPLMQRMADMLMTMPGGEVTAAALLSQFISNVPTAIFLASFSDHWQGLAWGANVGGFGLAIGSLANLIALRLGQRQGLWLAFHAWSIPMLMLSLMGAFLV